MIKIELPQDYLGEKSIIYFLELKGEIVYIGETSKGLSRVFSHTGGKEFDSIFLELASDNPMERKCRESELIRLYNPKYNIRKGVEFSEDLSEYTSVAIVRDFLKKKGFYNITNNLKVYIKKNCRTKELGSSLYVHVEDLKEYLSENFSIIFSI